MATTQQPRRGGRPSKLTPERAAEITKAVQLGSPLDTAAWHSGIHPRTLSGWLARGAAAGRGRYYEFLCAVRRAEAGVELQLIGTLRKAALTNWTAALAMLSRRHPATWGLKPAAAETETEAEKAAAIRDMVAVMKASVPGPPPGPPAG